MKPLHCLRRKFKSSLRVAQNISTSYLWTTATFIFTIHLTEMECFIIIPRCSQFQVFFPLYCHSTVEISHKLFLKDLVPPRWIFLLKLWTIIILIKNFSPFLCRPTFVLPSFDFFLDQIGVQQSWLSESTIFFPRTIIYNPKSLNIFPRGPILIFKRSFRI